MYLYLITSSVHKKQNLTNIKEKQTNPQSPFSITNITGQVISKNTENFNSIE